MATVGQVQIKTTGYTGSPGWTTLHASVTDDTTAETFLAWVKSWVNLGLRGFTPSTITWTVLGEVKIFNVATGILSSIYGGAAATYVGSSGTGIGPSPVGACFSWKTNTITPTGKKIRGRTFVVPMSNTMFDTDGTFTSAAVTALGNAGAGRVTGSPFPVIWHRPVGGAGGIIAPISSYSVADKAAVLRSRRD